MCTELWQIDPDRNQTEKGVNSATGSDSLFTLPHYSTTTNATYEGWNFNSGNYLFTTDIK